MKNQSSLLRVVPTLVLAGAALFVSPVRADHHETKKEAASPAGKLIPVTAKEAAWAAEARKAYPLDVCVVADDKLGSMGKSPEYIYRVAGKPDRLVVFCCSGCEEDFLKEPAKYLAKIDAAAKAKK
jgi:hypothetical protein